MQYILIYCKICQKIIVDKFEKRNYNVIKIKFFIKEENEEMYADWMKEIKLDVTPEKIEQYKEDKKK